MVIGVDEEPAGFGDVLRYLAAELDLAAPQVADESSSGVRGRRLSDALLRSTGFALAYPTFHEGYRSVLAGDRVRHP